MKTTAASFVRFVGSGLRTVFAATVALCLLGSVWAAADYLATVPASGTSFASKVISTVHHLTVLVCDTTVGEAQCAGINSIGQVSTTGIKKVVSAAPTVTASTYTAAQSIGGIIAFANALPNDSVNAAILNSITIKFPASAQTVGFFVCFFKTNSLSGTYTDHTSITYNAADGGALMPGCYHLTAALSPLGTQTSYTMDGIGKVLQGSSTSLYAVVAPDATTAALASTTDFVIEIGLSHG